MVLSVLERRIVDFARDATTGDFGELALAVFAYQFERLPAYRRHCEMLGVVPATASDWRAIPPVETRAGSEFGATQVSEPSAFQRALLRVAVPDLFAADRLWLMIQATGSGTLPLIDALAHEAPSGSFLSHGKRLDAKGLRSWLGTRQRDRRPVALVATPAGCLSLVQLLERRCLKFRLPPGSAAIRLATIENAADVSADAEWHAPLAEVLGLPTEGCRQMICGPAFSTALLEAPNGPHGVFRLPHWVRATSVDSTHIAILDLAALAGPAGPAEPAELVQIETPAHRIERVAVRVDSDRSGNGQNLVLI